MSGQHHRMDLTFARRLEALMTERDIYPAAVARMTGLKRSAIHEYAKGTRQPSAYAVKKIAVGLGVSADWLLGIEESTANGTK